MGTPTFTDVNGTPLKTAPTSLNSGQSAYLDVTLTNDPQLLGADWSVYCGSAPPPGTPPPPGQTEDQTCGTFTPAHTISGPVPSYVTSGSGYVTLYTAPAVPPKQGTVTLYASSTSNPSRWSSVTLSVIGLPISVGFAPAPPATLDTGATTSIKAVVNNDAANAGVTWTTICASSDCGSFNPAQTASGVTTTYAAPAAVPTGGTVQVVATSVTDPTKAATATISIAAATASTLSGNVQTSHAPVTGAQISLYAARTSSQSQSQGESLALATTFSDDDGNFSFAGDFACPSPDTQLYLLAKGGNADGESNPDLTLISAVGSCAKLGSSNVVINEATTVAAVYALSPIIIDELHVGSSQASLSAVASAFATANDLVDPSTGLVRARTVSGAGIVPQTKIDTLANLLSACARMADSVGGDVNPCDQFFTAVTRVKEKTERSADTFNAMLYLARHPVLDSNGGKSSDALYELASSDAPFEPVLAASPQDWAVSIVFPLETPTTSRASQSVFADAAGNIWVSGSDGSRIEFVGGGGWFDAPMNAGSAADGAKRFPKNSEISRPVR